MNRRALGALVAILAAIHCGRDAQTVADPCRLTPAAVRAEFRVIAPDSTRVKLAGVTRAEVGHDGRLFVLDGSGPVLFALDTLGRTTVIVDRAGPGPGELKDPRAFAFDSRRHLWIASPNPPTITEYDSSGHYVRSLPYWRAFMVSDMAFDAADNPYLAYRVLNPQRRLADGSVLVTLDRLRIENDTVIGVALDSITSTKLAQAPYFNSPIIEFSIASSATGAFVRTLTLAYYLGWVDSLPNSERTILGCQDGVDNEERLKKATMFEGGYTLITHDLAFASDGSLYHLTANVRADSTQRLDRFDRRGRLVESLLLPSRRKGGAYLSALLPTVDPNVFWGYEIGGNIYTVRIHR